MTPLLGYAPDLPRTTPGVIPDCSAMIPYEAGMEAAASARSTGADALAAAAVGGFVWTKLDGTTRIFAGSSVRLYDLGGTTWTDRSAGGVNYSATNFWTFAPFGASIVAAGDVANTLQQSTTAGFTAISGAPKALVVFSVITSGGGFVIAANTDTATDQWACSGVNDHTTWATSVATQANSGRLLGNDAGAITAGIEFGDRAVIFKRRAMFIGDYVGSFSGTFQFRETGGGAGCVGPYAVANVDIGLLFVGPYQIWLYDGAVARPIGDAIRQWFFDDLSGTYINHIRVVYDQQNSRVRIHYPRKDSSTGLCNGCIVYHLKTGKWGVDHMTVEHAMVYIEPGITWSTVTGTWAAIGETWDSGALDPSARAIAVFNSSHVLQTLTGTPGSSYFITNDFGDEFSESFMDEVRLRYALTPTTASATGYTLDEAADAADTQATESSYDEPADALNKFDLRQSARFHRVQFNFTGGVRVLGYQPKLQPAGGR